MANNCVPCLSFEFKKAIDDKFQDDSITTLLASIETCAPGTGHINLCKGSSGKRAPRAKGEKRAPSKYQAFVGQCLRDKHLKGFDPQAMKDCAHDWKSSPDNPKRGTK